ncbi:hypothetical protein [Paenibacillus sp. V4I5]|uniref:hypothetical protein n=1 Tax=Paenibacillus sp. V4I5 TaxID=3042306 RepID=UPI002790AE54|nr:hypothetical protein [Paenibacillus sp. V4I5]MDQ0917538.1 hypothetical protein [Paenibacillus sp. V4I5]
MPKDKFVNYIGSEKKVKAAMEQIQEKALKEIGKLPSQENLKMNPDKRKSLKEGS